MQFNIVYIPKKRSRLQKVSGHLQNNHIKKLKHKNEKTIKSLPCKDKLIVKKIKS